jgi:hypothetical protein
MTGQAAEALFNGHKRLQCLHHIRTHAQIRHEQAIHNIHVDKMDAGFHRLFNLFSKARKKSAERIDAAYCTSSIAAIIYEPLQEESPPRDDVELYVP